MASQATVQAAPSGNPVPPTLELDARGVYYRDLNARIRRLLKEKNWAHVSIHNVCGQRYIGTSLHQPVHMDLYGTPGNDLGAFMDGPTIVVHGNAQDACGNTLDGGRIIIHGRAGDVTGYSMRSGAIFVQGDVGYRAGIHMKAFGERQATLVIGGTAQPYLGEYMAGGIVLLLGLTLGPNQLHTADHIGTGMHGGVIYLRGRVEAWQLGREVGTAALDDGDRRLVEALVSEYCAHFGGDPSAILSGTFHKLIPLYLRPYGNLYAY